MTPWLRNPDRRGRHVVLVVLDAAGPGGANVVPDLREVLGDSELDVRFHAACVLARLDRDAARQGVPTLMEFYRNGDAATRKEAADLLKNLDPPAATEAGIE
jgi:HEAT repeat protein